MLYKCKNYAQLVKFGESTSRFEEILKQKQRDLKSALWKNWIHAKEHSS